MIIETRHQRMVLKQEAPKCIMLVYCGSQKRNDSSCAIWIPTGASKGMIALQHPDNVTSVLFFLECRFLSGHLRDRAFFLSEKDADCLTSKGTKRSANHVPVPHSYENRTMPLSTLLVVETGLLGVQIFVLYALH
jgi:hypothetical protein